MNFAYRLVAILLVLLHAPATAQEQGQPLSGYTPTRWTPREGSPSEILDLAQTTDGTLWIAGDAGLTQFDGVRFRRYGDRPNEKLPSKFVGTLTAPASGGLWIGFRFGGVAFLKDGTLTTYGAKQGLPDASVHRMLVEENGALWVATSAGLGRLKDGRWEAIDSTWGLPAGNAWDVVKTRAGVIWARIAEGLYYRLPGEDRFVAPKDYDQYSDVFDRGLAEAPDGNLWAIGATRGLRSVTESTVAFETSMSEQYRVAMAKGITHTWQLLFEPDGTLWYFARNSVHRISNPMALRTPGARGELHHEEFGAAQGFASPSLRLLRDREGNLWLTNADGLTRLTPSSFHLVETSVHAFLALSHSPDDSMVWAQSPSTLAEIVHYRDGRVDWRMPSPASMSAAYRGNDGVVWFGSPGRVWRLDGSHLTAQSLPPELSGFDVQALIQDSDDSLWCSIQRRGVFRYSHGVWQRNGGLDGLPQEPAIAMARDDSGRIWLAYTRGRVGLVDGQNARTLGISEGLPDANITAIGLRHEHVWIGSEAGLYWFEGVRFRALHVGNDNALAGLWGIAETSAGDLWTAGTSGVTHLTAQQISGARSNGHLEQALQVFSARDGIPGGVQGLRPTPALVQAGDGKLWIALAGGIGYIDPANLIHNRHPPPVQIVSLLASGQEYSAQDSGIVLSKGTSQLRIPYTAYSLAAPERVRFKYRLEGFDQDWQDAGDRREATYTHVSPGAYRFQVIAANEDGVWNEAGASLRFVIPPTFTQTPWFYLLCAIAGFTLLFALYRLRLHQHIAAVRLRLEERIIEREKIARDLHDTLLQGFQGLILRFQAAANRMSPQDPSRPLLQSTLERADQVMIEARNRVKDLRGSAQLQAELPSELAGIGNQLAEHSGATFSMIVEGEPRGLHPIVKEEALLIGREAIGNAFRHSAATNVELEIMYAQSEWRMRIRDNGRGIPATVLAEGGLAGHWGLQGMRERAKRLRGQLDIWSRDGAGTEVELRVNSSMAYREPARDGTNL